MVRATVRTGDEETVAELPPADVYAAPSPPWLAYVTSAPSEDDDFAAEPRLTLFDAGSAQTVDAGSGVAPVWSADATRLAFLRPVEDRACRGEACEGAVQIGVADVASGQQSTMLEPGRYSILGWAGDRVLVSDFGDTSRIVAVSLDGDGERLDLAPSELWTASPDGRWVLATRAGRTEFLSLEGAALGGRSIEIDLGGRTLLEAAWSPDSSRLAAITSDGGRDNEVATFSPEDPDPAPIEGSGGALGTLLWAPDSAAVAFAGVADPGGARLAATHCSMDGDGCRRVFSWRSGITLLRIE